MAVAARGMAKAAELLGRQFTLVLTNVPYLAADKQTGIISTYCEVYFPDSKRTIAYCIVQRVLRNLCQNGAIAVVLPQNWLFQPAYPELRK